MRGYLVPVISIAMIVSSPSARSDEIPTLDVRPVCRGIASQAAEPLATGLPSSFDQCVKSEEEVREQLKREWPTFSAADKQHCVTLAKTGGESSNTELLTCLEMARDVRALRSAAAAPSGTERAKQPAPSLSMPTVQPVPAAKASQPPPAKGSPAAEGDQMMREVERAKAAAQAAKDSEARGRLSANSLMLKRLEWQPKGENKPAIAPLKPHQVLARHSDRGSGPESLTPRTLKLGELKCDLALPEKRG